MDKAAEGNLGGAPDRKARKSLPSMDVDAVSSAGVNVDASPAQAAAVDYAAQIKVLEFSLAKASRMANIGTAVAVAAVLVALSSPWWQPRTFDNDLATRQTTLLATAHLRQLAAQDAPFGQEMALLSRVLPKDAAINEVVATIEPLAATGAPTLADLRDHFRGIADEVLVGKVVAKDDQSWWNWGVHKLATAMRVEALADTVTSPSVDLREVHDADAALKEGNLKAAIEHLSKLDGSAAEVVREWLAEARSRADLDDAIAKLSRSAEARAANSAWIR